MVNRRNALYLSAVPVLLAAVQAAPAYTPGTLSYVLSPTPVAIVDSPATLFVFGPGNGNRTTAYSGAGGDIYSFYGTNYGTGVSGAYLRNDASGAVFNSNGLAAVSQEVANPLSVQTYLPNGNAATATGIGPTGPEYFNGTSFAGNQPDAAAPSAGYVVGFANRNGLLTTGGYGEDGWAYTPATATTAAATNIIGLFGGKYDDVYTSTYNGSTGAGIYRWIQPVGVNNNGLATGYTYDDYTTTSGTGSIGAALGRDAWVTDTTAATPTAVLIGLTGAGYFYNSTFTPPTTGPNPGVPVAYVNNTSVSYGVNDAGTAMGFSSRYKTTANSTTAGQDAWIYNGNLGVGTAGTIQIGLTGNIYTFDNGVGIPLETSLAYQVNSRSQIAGYSMIYANSALATNSSTPLGVSSTSLGQDAWVYTPNTTASGVVTSAGTANAFGTTAAGTYAQAGLIDSLATSPGSVVGSPSPTSIAGHVNSNGGRSSFIAFLNNSGQAAGVSIRYFTTSTANFGQDAWFFNGTTTKIITPVSTTPGVSYYFTTAANGLPNATSGVSYLSDTGIAAGWVYRYPTGSTTRAGEDAWVYDSNFNNGDGTFGKVFTITSPTASTAAEDLTINYVSNSGIVLGSNSTSSGIPTAANTSPFVWTETGGYRDLTSILSTSLSSAGWNALIGSNLTEVSALYVDSNNNIYGYGITASGVNAFYELTPSILGDANSDGHVDLTDLSTVLNNFGTTTALWANGNFDGASTIDLTDLSDVLNNFGTSSPSLLANGSVAAAPEPACLGILGTGALFLLGRRRRA